MPFKLNISDKGKAWRMQLENETIVGKRLGEIIPGKDISADLEGYELEITGATDLSGFPYKKDLQGPEVKRLILTRGWGMHKKPRRGGKKKTSTPKGLRLRKSVRGNQLSEKTALVNLKVTKSGKKRLSEIFPEQNQTKEIKATAPVQQAQN